MTANSMRDSVSARDDRYGNKLSTRSTNARDGDDLSKHAILHAVTRPALIGSCCSALAVKRRKYVAEITT